jgi:hypothetical protein
MKTINQGGPAFPISVLGETLVGQEGMTLRQYAAIKLKVPDSGTDWLDGMILESLRNDLAAKSLQGLMNSWAGHTGTESELIDIWAVSSCAVADAMLAAREAK